MPVVKSKDAKIHYEVSGSGDPVIALHGLSENTSYWNMTGITSRLSEKYRFIAMDMRGHGKTGGDAGTSFTDTAIMDDIDALADSLGIDRFHLLGHSTGGMVSVRYAMRDDSRIMSLILNGSCSSTDLFPGDEDARLDFREKFANGFGRHTWKEIVAYSRKNPFPFFIGISKRENNDALWRMVEDIFSLNDTATVAAFIRSFYVDPDPMAERLGNISCPTLILLGEHDVLMKQPSQLMANSIPGARQVIMPGVGHMTAIEDPDNTAGEIISFLRDIPHRNGGGASADKQ